MAEGYWDRVLGGGAFESSREGRGWRGVMGCAAAIDLDRTEAYGCERLAQKLNADLPV